VEIYRVIGGSDTLVTGGLLNLPLADPIGDDIVRTEHGIEGGTAKQAMCLFYNPALPLVQLDRWRVDHRYGIQSRDHHRTSSVSVILTEAPEHAQEAARRRTAISSFPKPA